MLVLSMVGAVRFERTTPCTPCRCASRLRHAPTSSKDTIADTSLQAYAVASCWYNGSVKLEELHRWDVSTKEALELQHRLAPSVSHTRSLPRDVRYVAGLDISAPRQAGIARGAAVVLRYPSLELEEVR